MKFIGSTTEYLHLEAVGKNNCDILTQTIESALSIVWFKTGNNELKIDGQLYSFKENQIVFLTEFHRVEIKSIDAARFLRFNRPFYCVLDHDNEVGCKGVLFFGASQLPIIKIPRPDKEKFETLWDMFEIEMQSNDDLQIDMLQMMLKRYLILCTRIYKAQEDFPDNKPDSDLVRDFNFLVESHFRTKHTVAEYADLLHKSPKTISNIFSKIGSKTPLQYIKERKMLESRRLLHYSEMKVQEVAYEVGFDDIQAFSRFFKKYEGISPSEFKQKKR